MSDCITGIQQAGIGVCDVQEAKHLYKKLLGMNVLIFDDCAEASLMTAYTGRQVHQRHAILTINMSGGGGLELWQYTSRTAIGPVTSPVLGDLGIFALKIKSKNVALAHSYFSNIPNVRVSELLIAPDDRPHFWLADQYQNHFNIVEGDEWFSSGNSICGGVVGAVIGVSDMNKALHFYRETLGINETIYAGIAPMIDVPFGHHEGQSFHRVLLKKQVGNRGAFSKLFGAVQIELVEAKEMVPTKIYENRMWGDCGFIHLCFDVLNMNRLQDHAAKAGYLFSVDSGQSFKMDSAAGRFCYLEDPDGTLIELVETHKVPILKKLGWYLDLTKRKSDKPLPSWMIGMLGLSKVR